MKYQENKKAAITRNTDPTETDQAGANDTDINVIVEKFMRHGQLPQGAKQPISGDFTQVPRDLHEAFENARSIKENHAKLPQELRNMPFHELMALTPDELVAKIKPPTKKVDDKKEEGDK